MVFEQKHEAKENRQAALWGKIYPVRTVKQSYKGNSKLDASVGRAEWMRVRGVRMEAVMEHGSIQLEVRLESF